MACKLNTRRSGDGAEGLLAEYEFDQPRITIGRGPGNDVVFKDPTRMVSTKHAEIRAGDPSWVLVDVGSTNGTTLNGTRITAKQPYALHDGDCISVGPFQLVFRDARPAAGPDAVAQPARSVPVVAGTPSSPTGPGPRATSRPRARRTCGTTRASASGWSARSPARQHSEAP